MKSIFLIALAVVSVSSSTPTANGGISWCEYARATGRDMPGCNNGQPVNSNPGSEPVFSILPVTQQPLPKFDACAAMFCIAATTTCINGQCVPLPNGGGSSRCAFNEEYVTCSSCENSCGKPNAACPMMCGPAKCECVAAKGFARDSYGRCVARSQCPTTSNTGNAFGCAATTCPFNYLCVEQQVQCFAPPCNPIAKCVMAATSG